MLNTIQTDGPADERLGTLAAATNALNVPLAVTFFDDAYAATKREQRLSLSDLTLYIEIATAASKAALPWLKLARFGDVSSAGGSLRHDKNVLAVSGVEGDYDGEVMTVNEACRLLRAAKLAAVVYTSPRHTDEKPRWRVLCPLSKEMIGADLGNRRAELVGRVNGVLGGVLKPESFVLSQAFYYGSVNCNKVHRVEMIEGGAIDLRDDLPAVGVPVAAPTVRQEGPFDWDQRAARRQEVSDDHIAAKLNEPTDDRSAAAFRMILYMRHAGWSPREITDKLTNFADSLVMEHYGDDEDRVRADVRRAFTKEAPQDKQWRETTEEWARKQQQQGGAVATDGPDDAKPDADPKGDNRSYVEIVCATDIEITDIRWMWPGWIARHKFQLLAGIPGDGKSTILFDIAATITRGGTFPDGSRAKLGSVLIWSGEDTYADTVVPRFLAAGGVRDKLHCVKVVRGHDDKGEWRRPFDPATDMPGLIEAASRIKDLALVIVDPVVAMVAGDGNRNNDVRRGLQPLVTLAEERGVAVVGLTHFNKNSSGNSVLDRINGSLAYGALARLAWGTARSLENPHNRVLVRAKSNIGPDGDGFTYTLEAQPVPGKPGMTARVVRWGAPVYGTAEAILARYGAGQKQEDKAKLLLLELVRDGPVPVVDIRKRAEAEGISRRSLERAKEDLKLVLSGNPKAGYTWALPAEVGDQTAPRAGAAKAHATVH